jgi:ParB family transcriptional regulator, chromosome partitioning protein
MKKKSGRKVLGRGLSALISTQAVPVHPDVDDRKRVQGGSSEQRLRTVTGGKAAPEPLGPQLPEPGDEVRYLPLDKIGPNPFQPRKFFDDSELQELAASIRAMGVLQPILVRPPRIKGDELFEIVAGERRWRAARLASLSQVPVIIRQIGDKGSLEIALVENVQRANLNPIEEAEAYQNLVDEFSLNQQQISERVGKDRATVANYLRLLKLPQEAIELIRTEKLSMGHAKAILTVREPAVQLSLAKRCVSEGLSVRAVEDIVSRVVVLDAPKKGQQRKQAQGEVAAVIAEVTDKLRNALGTKVSVSHRKTGRGRIEIEYFSEQELERLMDILCR